MQWIYLTDLESWAETIPARSTLPRLLRRLVHATLDKGSIDQIDFPSDESVKRKGYDGLLSATSKNSWIPEGVSVWELGCSKGIEKKANKDYEDRKKQTLETNPKDTTFIFVTPRYWEGKRAWAANKKKEGFWKDVRAYDADDLLQWLEQAPSVEFWFASLLNKRSKQCRTIEEFWTQWATLPGGKQFPKKLPMLGRESDVEYLLESLQSEPCVVYIQAESHNEGLSFIYSVIEEHEDLISRTVIAEDLDSLRELPFSTSQLIIIPCMKPEERAEAYHWIVEKGHHVIVLFDEPAKNPPGRSIVLKRTPRESIREALIAEGISDSEARRLAEQSGNRISTLKNLLSATEIVLNPQITSNPRMLLPFTLLASWDRNNENDRQLVSSIIGKPYDDYERELIQLLGRPNSPVNKIRNIWKLTVKSSWMSLASSIIEKDLERLQEIAVTIHTEIHPQFEVEESERWLHGKSLKYSSELREGVADTLVFCGVFSEHIAHLEPETVRYFVRASIEKILSSTGWETWASFSSFFPQYAEADPNTFMKMLEKALSSHPEDIEKLHKQDGSGFMGRYYHSSLYWALEGLAWNPQYLPRVAILITRLSEFKPDGNIMNSPANSFKGIFSAWLVGTCANTQEKLDVLDLVIKKYPELAFSRLMDILPELMESGTEPHRFIWRKLARECPKHITNLEYWSYLEEVTKRAFELVKASPKRWLSFIDVIEKKRDFHPALMEDAFKHLEEVVQSTTLEYTDRLELRDKLRGIITHHKRFPEANWVLPKATIERLEQIYVKLEPEDLIDKYSWLFNDGTYHVFDTEDWKASEAKLKEKRQEAIIAVVTSEGIQGLQNLITHSDRPEYVGYLLPSCNLSTVIYEDIVAMYLQKGEIKIRVFSETFAETYVREKGWDLFDKFIERAKAEKWNRVDTVKLLVSLPFIRKTWEYTKNFDDEVSTDYWKDTSARAFSQDFTEEDIDYFVNKLISVDRSIDAFFALRYKDNLSSKTTLRLLEALKFPSSKEDNRRPDPYNIEQLFKIIEQDSSIPKDKIAALEWLYYPIFRSGETTRHLILHDQVLSDASLFAELISFAFKAENDDRDQADITEREKSLAERAFHLFHGISGLPGLKSDGQLDKDFLFQWFHSVREKSNEIGRLVGADIALGEILGRSPAEADGQWPMEPVRDLIEEIASDELDRHIKMAVYNSRGVTSRAYFEGGNQERTLSSSYEKLADTYKTKWPRTSQILIEIAQSYQWDAKRHDDDAELRQLD